VNIHDFIDFARDVHVTREKIGPAAVKAHLSLIRTNEHLTPPRPFIKHYLLSDVVITISASWPAREEPRDYYKDP
jgi:hypothetical protein